MAQITETYKLNMTPGRIPLMVNVSQDDALWKSLKFQLLDGSQYMTIPSGTIALINGKKSDGKGFSYQMTVNASDHSVQIDVQKQMTAASGITLCEVSLHNGTSIIGSANFILRVEKNPLDDAVMSDSDLNAVTEALANITKAMTAADTATRKASEAAASAGKAAESAQSASTSESNAENYATATRQAKDAAITAIQKKQESAILAVDTEASKQSAASAQAVKDQETSSISAVKGQETASIKAVQDAQAEETLARQKATAVRKVIESDGYLYNEYFDVA